MKNNIYKPLDKYEIDLEKALDSSSIIKRPKDYQKFLAEALVIANNTSSKSKAISIRVPERDLIKLKSRANEVGIAYQSLINTLIHQYIKGWLDVKI